MPLRSKDRQNPPARLARSPGLVTTVLMAVAALAASLLPLVYLLLVEAVGIFLGWSFFLTGKGLLAASSVGFTVTEVCRLACLGLATMGWAAMLGPLVTVVKKTRASMPASEHTQPELFALVSLLCRHLRAPAPGQIMLDCSGSIRARAKTQAGSPLRRRLILDLSLPMVSAFNARELAAVLAMRIANHTQHPCLWLAGWVDCVDGWFFRSLHRRESWEPPPLPREDSQRSDVMEFAWRVERAFIWLMRMPFWLLHLLLRATAWAPRRLLRARAEKTARDLIGPGGFQALRQKLGLFTRAERQVRKTIQDAKAHPPLPDNLPLLTARLFAALLGESPPLADAELKSAQPAAASIIHHLGVGDEAVSLVHDYVGLSRQLTSLHYQLEAGLPVHHHQLASLDETAWQQRHHTDALATIHRCFHGLMHPERTLIGLGGARAGAADMATFKQDIIEARNWLHQHEAHIRAAAREWNLAWQRRRDLESAWALSLAGMTVCRTGGGPLRYGPDCYRAEAVAQRKIMEHLDEPLRMCESRMERRMAAGIGLLWSSDPAALPERLRDIRARLAHWVALHEALAGSLAEFRELLTAFHSFQVLEAKSGGYVSTGAFASAMQALFPGMMARARQIAAALDGACFPFAADGIAVPLSEFLCAATGGKIPPDSHTAPGMHEMVHEMSQQARAVLTPFVNRYLEWYHRSFGWLAAAAESAELYFVGPAERGIKPAAEVESMTLVLQQQAESRKRKLVLA